MHADASGRELHKGASNSFSMSHQDSVNPQEKCVYLMGNKVLSPSIEAR